MVLACRVEVHATLLVDYRTLFNEARLVNHRAEGFILDISTLLLFSVQR
jgi:hypothetical protein